MAEYIEKQAALDMIESATAWRMSMNQLYDEMKGLPAADVAPVVHVTPMIKCRPERYEKYEAHGTSESGETLYLKRIFVDEKNRVMYCPACGKRLCSRFVNYCPNCGAKCDLEG